jgi:UDP-GlcNAc:undecaprenyl-phosphate GlcNAc-1-phosphate transferase
MTYLLQAAIACVLTAVLIPWMRRPAERFGLVDHPGGRKRHDGARPVTGGLAIAVSFFLSLGVSLPALGDYHVLFVAIAMLAIVGVLDDLGVVSPRAKLGVQVLASVLMTSWAGNFLVTLGDLFGRGQIELHNWSIPLTVFASVAVINGINMFDGVDGLAGGLMVVMLAYFAYFAWWMGDANALKILVVLIGALIGFLIFNAPWSSRGPRTFMGDTGSLVLGFVVVWFTVEFTQGQPKHLPPVTMLWIVGIVLFDLFTVTIRRVVRRRDPASPDRAHIHHLLLRCGYSPAKTVLILVGVNLLLGGIGTAGWVLRLPEQMMFAMFLVVGCMYFGVFLFPARFVRFGRRVRSGLL